ncbi:unnamed protein product [Lepeophtheirus salmonis]|uniref:(salmon louse) hypothetical protein n=1 Tax=Lepeophtheirus salmonis TaxID=72036 RepID=A0A7R8CU33_LEPSM|nr:unnamed protein product [Lepeophtheirus salmonis]CAF2894929.1 unnamed protein product [Lepeophtheirus salmonis]
MHQARGGSGTSNDGNTARRDFQNSSKLAEITLVHLKFIQRLYTILQVIHESTPPINVDTFHDLEPWPNNWIKREGCCIYFFQIFRLRIIVTIANVMSRSFLAPSYAG